MGLRRPLPRSRADTPLRHRTPREHESDFHELDDRDPLTRFGRALEESAIELLAVDQRPLPTGPRHQARPQIERPTPSDEQRTRLRLIDQQRLAVSKARADAERKLDAAERDLSRHRLLARGRRRDALRSEIALRQTAIRMADEKLAELEQQHARARWPVPTRDRAGDKRPRLHERALDRRPPIRERGLGLEL